MLPILLKLDWFTLYSYPFFMGIGWAIGYIIAENNILKFSPNNLKKFPLVFFLIFLSSWIGSKVFFLLTSTPVQRLAFERESNFWLGGGFVFYGGLIFGLLSLIGMRLFYIRDNNFYKLLLPGLVIGHAVGRVGCFLAGCCYGKEWGLEIVPRVPVQLFESFGLLVIYVLIKKKIEVGKFNLGCGIYFIGYAILRFVLEFFRDDSLRGFWGDLSTSQWVSISILFIGIYFLKSKDAQNEK